ncbi:MAG: prephenate dehydratase [Lachnospiraceae bacterium]|nr:prephenate dehydratase [Lachnospiraceae bacterium]MDD7177450.1 prephenate dehydratase [bacterium]MDY5516452.1 prephenate dehydratase [Lachnospiraceae bacterium]
MKDLQEIRNDIDVIDKQIVDLYKERMNLTSEVASYKIATGKQVLDRERELSKLAALETLADSDFTKHGIRELFEQIMSTSRKKQYQLLTDCGKTEDLGFTEIPSLQMDGVRVVYQGVEGAYTHQALAVYFGEDTECFNVETWRDAMEAIKSGAADYAVLPFENSSAGIVAENYDLLKEYGYYIVGEQKIKINHCILGLQGVDFSDIKKIYSHPQALAQCSKYLEKHREWEVIPEKNTAMAAKKVEEDADSSQAAIASSMTAELYGLQILAEGVQNNNSNETRFIIVSRKNEYVSGAGKISICVQLKHESGALYHALSHFIYNGLNMTSIESRPIQGRNWEYQFFIDFDGNLKDAAVQNALRGLKEETLDLKIFGNY